MSIRIFSDEQVKTLLKNQHVESCSEKSIGYSKSFKIAAVKEWQSGVSPKEIFIQAGFDVNMIGNKKPGDCILRWRRIFEKKGREGLKKDGRGQSKSGGRPKKHWQNDKEKIEYLEAEVAYLKTENDFLARLRKKR